MEPKANILIVDDNRTLCESMKCVLEENGYQVECVFNGNGAIELARNNNYDIALIDIKLPDISGNKVVEKMVDISPSTEYIYMTGYATINSAIEAVKQKQVISYETKPFEIYHILPLINQIIERKRMEDALLQTEKFKSLGVITSGIAHEFNNLLSIIISTAELLGGGFEDEQELKDGLNTIIEAGDDGADIVKNMIKYARSQSKDTSDYIFFDIKYLLKEVIDFTRPRWKIMAEANGIDYHIDKEGIREIPEVLCNPTELREVFANIVNNALDAMPDGGRISFKTWSNEDNVFVSISDTGSGIHEDVQERVFDPFFTTRRPHGIGLGMSVSYGVIMRHNGKIWIESEDGKGTTFNLSIPIQKDVVQKIVPSEPEQKVTTRKLDILVVDDNEDLCDVLGDFLTRIGHTVKSFNNSTKALELIGKETFDLVLCDLVMPDIHGYDVIKTINKLGNIPKIGIMTGWDEDGMPIDDENFKVDFILKKPFKHKELTKNINLVFAEQE